MVQKDLLRKFIQLKNMDGKKEIIQNVIFQ